MKNKRKPKIRKLVMTWESQAKHERIELWRLIHGKADHDLIPMNMFMDMYQGDLAIALRKHLIPEKQVFQIHCKLHAVCDATGECIDADFSVAPKQKMTLHQFLFGSDDNFPDDILNIDQGHGLKTRWKGFNTMLEDYADTLGDDEYRLLTNHCTLTCFAALHSFAAENILFSEKIAFGSKIQSLGWV